MQGHGGTITRGALAPQALQITAQRDSKLGRWRKESLVRNRTVPHSTGTRLITAAQENSTDMVKVVHYLKCNRRKESGTPLQNRLTWKLSAFFIWFSLFFTFTSS